MGDESTITYKSNTHPPIEYRIQSMTDWNNVEADLMIVDPPFGIEFTGTETNYARDENQVVSGYVEWSETVYRAKINDLLSSASENLAETGQALFFSGWNNSHIIHQAINEHELNLEGKLYWTYNFAPYCRKRPAHNVYEIFWVTKTDDWYYNNECSYEHCTKGEANLSHVPVKREYHKDMPKYPTRLPEKIVKILVDHYSQPGDTVFDPCAGSGMVGIAAAMKQREAVLGDLNEDALNVFEKLYELKQVEGAFSQEQLNSFTTRN